MERTTKKEDFYMEETKNNQKQTPDCDTAIKTAQFRFSLIAPVIQGLVPDGSDTAYFMRITKDPLTLPDGRSVKYSWKTPQKWHYLYKKGGFDALLPKTRSDKGIPRALPDTAIEEIYRLKEKYPRLNATQIHIRLMQDAFIPATVSVDAVQRFIRNNGLKSSRELTRKDRKAFEEDSFGRLWQADTCHFCYINDETDKKAHKVYLVIIIDDHSRMIVGGGMSYSDNSYGFQKVLKEAVSTYGIPDKLYTDNGSPYIDRQLSLICGSIGTVLLHAPVRDGAAKAKVERNFRSMREKLLYGLDLEKIRSLQEFNALLKDYIRRHNTAYHSGIGCALFERYQATKEHMKIPRSREWLEECFLNRVTRQVKKDATVSIDCKSYDVPMQFISQKVEIRYLPEDMDSAFILYEGEHFTIRATDKNQNCRTKREDPVIDYTKIGGGD